MFVAFETCSNCVLFLAQQCSDVRVNLRHELATTAMEDYISLLEKTIVQGWATPGTRAELGTRALLSGT